MVTVFKLIFAILYLLTGAIAITYLDTQLYPGIFPSFMAQPAQSESKLALAQLHWYVTKEKIDASTFDFDKFAMHTDQKLVRSSIGMSGKCFPSRKVNSLEVALPELEKHKQIEIHRAFFANLPCPKGNELKIYAITSKRVYNSIWSYRFAIDENGQIVEVDHFGVPLEKRSGLRAIGVASIALLIVAANVSLLRKREDLWYFFVPTAIIMLGLWLSVWTATSSLHLWQKV